METGSNLKTGIVIEAIWEGYKDLKYAYRVYGDKTQIGRKIVLKRIELLKEYSKDFDEILLALSNFETSFMNRGKDKVTTILLKELGEVIKTTRRGLKK